jgi:hypothetical protein
MIEPCANRQVDPASIALQYGKVLEKEGEGCFLLETAGGTVKARRAVSCLVEPGVKDLALFSLDEFGRAYVLSVLEREGEGPVALTFEGDVELKALAGRVRIAGQEGVDIATAELNLVSGRLNVNAAEAQMSVPRLHFFGSFLEGQVERIKLIGETCDSVFERVSQRVQRSYRWVAELDQLRAGHLNYIVKKLMNLRGQYTVMTAEKDVRIDGDKILMG